MNQPIIQIETPLANSQGATEPVQLVQRALSGCADAFQELVMLYAPRLLVLLTHRHRGNRADAEDVVQETALRAFQSWHRYDPRHPFRVWYFTIAFRISTDHLRKVKRDALRLVQKWEWFKSPRVHPCPIEQQESVSNIWKTAEKELGEYHFSVLWLSLGEELTNREIAIVLGKNVLSIRVALHRAKKTLANCLAVKNGSPLSLPLDSQDT